MVELHFKHWDRLKNKRSHRASRRIRTGSSGCWNERPGFKSMAGRQGFEPRYADPESAVLPLDDLPTRAVCAQHNGSAKGALFYHIPLELTRKPQRSATITIVKSLVPKKGFSISIWSRDEAEKQSDRKDRLRFQFQSLHQNFRAKRRAGDITSVEIEGGHLTFSTGHAHHQLRGAGHFFDVDFFKWNIARAQKRFRHSTIRAPGCGVHDDLLNFLHQITPLHPLS